MEDVLHIAILANFVATELSESLGFWLNSLQIANRLSYGPSDQVIQQLLDPASLIADSDIAIVLVQIERWSCRTDDITSTDLVRNIDDFISAIKAASHSSRGTTFLVVVCPQSPKLRGHDILAMAETKLFESLVATAGIDVITTQDLLTLYPIDDYSAYFDPYADQLAQIPYTRRCFASLGTLISRRLYALQRPARKVIAVDCDNTLWTGLCGDDGSSTLVITSGQRILQQFLIRQFEGGRLLCLCSKNEESNVWRVFDTHPDMLLKRDHLTTWQINWNPKPDNVRLLSEELGIGLDTFVFLDDDTFECDIMRQLIPQVLTVHLPADTSYELRLRDVWDLDLRRPTLEDKRRSLYYRQNVEREKARSGLPLEDFLARLELEVDIAPLSVDNLARASELTLRTNQFTLNGRRRSEAQLKSLLAVAESNCYTVHARDRFGDYGIVGLLITHVSGKALVVDTFLLSCRALGRGIEQRMASWLVQEAQSASVTNLAFAYRSTERNTLMRTFLSQAGLSSRDDFQSISVRDICLSSLLSYSSTLGSPKGSKLF